MRAVLLQLALTSNGRTANWQPSGSCDPDWTPRLAAQDAPHEHYARAFAAARDDGARADVLERAHGELRAIRHTRAPRGGGETLEERDHRMIEHGEGIAARDLAISMRCSLRAVHRARAAAGRETEFGRRPRNGHALGVEQRRAEVLRLVDDGMSARQAAVALGVSYKTIRRDLGRNA